MGRERLQKLIAAAGITSRRKAERLIEAGRVSVNGETVRDLGTRADPGCDEIRVDGERLTARPLVWIAVHKPRGVVTSVTDPHADRVVLDLIGEDVDERVYPAGRLDLDSEGLVLLTNDGDLMHAMTRPGGPVDKVYEVEVEGRPSEAQLQRLRRGASIDGRRLLPCEIEPLGEGVPNARYRVVLHEGKKNQIRRMFADSRHPVVRLTRTRIGPVVLEGLAPGAWRHLRRREVEELRALAGLAGVPTDTFEETAP